MTCFAKLSLPARALGLPMDVLNSVGVLRLEKSAADFTAASEQQQQQNGHAVGPRAVEGMFSFPAFECWTM